MRLRLTDPALVDDLLDFLGRTECCVRRAGDEIEISVPRARDQEEGRREVDLYLAAWRAMNPGARVDVVD